MRAQSPSLSLSVSKAIASPYIFRLGKMGVPTRHLGFIDLIGWPMELRETLMLTAYFILERGFHYVTLDGLELIV